MKLDLQKFAGALTLTIYNDGNFSATTGSPSSSLAENDKSTLTITANTGYELDTIEVISGGATILNESGTWKVKMGASNAVIYVKGKKNNVYKVTENCYVCVNGGTPTELQRNMTIEYGKTGAIVGVNSTGTALTISADVIAALVDSGVLIKV